MAWFPANRFEREMAHALTGANIARYFQAFTRTDLLLPQRPTPDRTTRATEQAEGAAAWRPVALEVGEHVLVPVFTSPECLAAALDTPVESCLLSRYEEVRQEWPDPAWLLAVNPGTPIEAYLPFPAVATALDGEIRPEHQGDVVIHRLGEQSWDPWPPGGPEQAVREAVALGDGAEYLDALRSCMVVVPTTRGVDQSELADHLLRNPGGFPFRLAGGAEPVVEVFTDEALLEADSPRVTVRFSALFWMFPQGCGLSVNPGGPAGLDLASEHIPLINQWLPVDPVPPPVLLGMRWAGWALPADR